MSRRCATDGKNTPERSCYGIFGYRNAELLYAVEECRKTGAEVIVCTDDGSAGVHGLVTGPLEQLLQEKKVDCVMALRPDPMLRAVQKLALEYGVEAQLSLEGAHGLRHRRMPDLQLQRSR